MRKWMRDRNRRRNKGQAPKEQSQPQQGDAPLQPTFLDRETNWAAAAEQSAADEAAERR